MRLFLFFAAIALTFAKENQKCFSGIVSIRNNKTEVKKIGEFESKNGTCFTFLQKFDNGSVFVEFNLPNYEVFCHFAKNRKSHFLDILASKDKKQPIIACSGKKQWIIRCDAHAENNCNGPWLLAKLSKQKVYAKPDQILNIGKPSGHNDLEPVLHKILQIKALFAGNISLTGFIHPETEKTHYRAKRYYYYSRYKCDDWTYTDYYGDTYYCHSYGGFIAVYTLVILLIIGGIIGCICCCIFCVPRRNQVQLPSPETTTVGVVRVTSVQRSYPTSCPTTPSAQSPSVPSASTPSRYTSSPPPSVYAGKYSSRAPPSTYVSHQ